jgi:hypothetical protein
MVRDYSKGLIYKLSCKDINVKEIYVGSSINMKQRKRQHKHCVINENSEKYNLKVYQYIRDNGGWDNWSMIWIKNYPCNNVTELKSEEDKIMRELNATLNTSDPIRDKEKRRKQCNQYKKNNKEKIKLKMNEWREKNKEHIEEYTKNYIRPNLEKRQLEKKETVICECGEKATRGHLARHRKTKKHQAYDFLKHIEESISS